MLGTSEGLRQGLRLGISDGNELGLRLSTGLLLNCGASCCLSLHIVMSKNKNTTGVTWSLACSFEIIFHLVVSFGVARITFYVYID